MLLRNQKPESSLYMAARLALTLETPFITEK